MSGDAGPRKRNKDKRKQKKDSVDMPINPKRLSLSDEEETLPGVHSGIENIQMHVQSKDHGVGLCAKIVFFTLMAILAGLVVLIVIENRGGSDLDTPLSESRFSDYLQGWVEENRQEDDHHDEPHFLDDHDHDEETGDHGGLEKGEPFPEEKDVSSPDEDAVEEQILNAELNANSEGNDDDDDDDDETNPSEVDDQSDNDDVQSAEEKLNEHPEAQENDEVDDDNDDNDDDNDDDNNTEEIAQEEIVTENSEPIDNQPDDDDQDTEEDQEQDDQQDDFLDDNLPFEEEKTEKPLSPAELEKMVDNLLKEYNEFAEEQGHEKVILQSETDEDKHSIEKRDVGISEKRNIDKFDDDDDNSFEEIVDNDAGEDDLLQRIAEKEKIKEEQKTAAEEAAPAESSHSKQYNESYEEIFEHDISTTSPVQCFRKITVTNRGTDEDEIEVEEIIGVFQTEGVGDEYYIEEGDYEEEIADIYQPQTFEEMNAMYRPSATIEEIPPEETQSQIVPEKIVPEKVSYEPKPESSVPVQKDERSQLNTQVPESSKVTVEELEKQAEKVDKFAVKLVLVPKNNQQKEVREIKEEIKDDEPIMSEEQKQKVLDFLEKSQPEEKSPERNEPGTSLEEPQEIEEVDADLDDYEAEYEDDLDDEDIDYDDEDLEDDDMEDEEDLSDVDDSDLMKRLEEKYGKLELKETKTEEDDDDVDDSWTKIPADRGSQSYMEELSQFNEELQNNPFESLKFYENILKINKKSVGALYGKAKSLETLAGIEKSNQKLSEAISIYKTLLENYSDKMTDDMFKSVGERCIDRMRFLGQYERTLQVHERLMDRFRDEPLYRNQLAVTFLLMNRLAEAKFVLHETLLNWRHDGFALVHYGFVLKNLDNDYEGAVMFLTEGIESNEPGTQDGRFYFTLGEALQRLGRNNEAMEVYRKGAVLKLFPSEYQRSLYNVERLKSRPFWTKAETTYKDHFTEISKYWEIIRDEGLKLLNEEGLFQDEHEKLMDKGDWKQLDLYTRGQKTKDCYKAPFTCKLLDSFKAAKCKRGQIKFSVIHPGTHVHPHCGPTNCRIRAHLGLKVPPKTFLRVVNETRSWTEGDWLIFDDSFEHEVWHNGTSTRLVLIVDVWHPDLTDIEKEEMSVI